MIFKIEFAVCLLDQAILVLSSQCVNKVMSDIPRIVDVAIRLVDYNLYLPDGRMSVVFLKSNLKNNS